MELDVEHKEEEIKMDEDEVPDEDGLHEMQSGFNYQYQYVS